MTRVQYIVGVLLEDEGFDARDYLLSPAPGNVDVRRVRGGLDYVDPITGSKLTGIYSGNRVHYTLVYGMEADDEQKRAAIGLRLLRYALRDSHTNWGSFGKETLVVSASGIKERLEPGESGNLWELLEQLEREHWLQITNYSGEVAYARWTLKK